MHTIFVHRLAKFWSIPTVSEIFVDGQVLLSEEGTTQGDCLAMPLYALVTISLIDSLSSVPEVK